MSLLNRTFGYRLEIGEDAPLFVIATVLPAPRGLRLPPDAAWIRAYSELCPHGEEGTVPVAWLCAEFAPATAYAMEHLFEDNPDAARRLAHRFPRFDMPGPVVGEAPQ